MIVRFIQVKSIEKITKLDQKPFSIFDRLRFIQGFLTKNNKEKIRDNGNCSVSAGVRFYQGMV